VDSYLPPGKKGEVGEGPHLIFLKLKWLLGGNTGVYDQALRVFAHRFGLLGLFHEEFSPPRPAHEVKAWAAPEAVIGANGALRCVDPAMEGTKLLLDLLQSRGDLREGKVKRGTPPTYELRGTLKHKRNMARLHAVALPSELECVRKPRYGFWGTEIVPWEEAKREYGGLLVLDEEADNGVSVLCTQEPYDEWQIALENFLYPNEVNERVFKAYLNRRIGEGVSLYSPEDEEGFRQGYRCSTLLKAIHLLIWLNKTGGGSIRKCEAPGCPSWFQAGSQPGSMYCPPPPGKKQSRCASRASSQMYRERQRRGL
jgi:hypothetical protein